MKTLSPHRVEAAAPRISPQLADLAEDGENFVWAQAEIQGNEVVVWNDTIAAPTVVHYAWDHFPTWANLFNSTGLGAAPFSTTETPAP